MRFDNCTLLWKYEGNDGKQSRCRAALVYQNPISTTYFTA